MEVIKHGILYDDTVEIVCESCYCEYSINKEDIRTYNKPIKVLVGFGDDYWKEKRTYYSVCPECGFIIPITDKEYKILTTNIKGDDDK